MGKLADLLKKDAETIRAEKAKRRQALQEWRDLLDGLFAQIDSWLKASDPEGLLEISADNVRINDPALSEYEAPARRVELGDHVAQIVPKARYVATTIQGPGFEKAV